MTEILRQRMAVQQQLAESNAKLAEVKGELRGSLTADLSRDELLHNNLRAREWLRHDPTLSLTTRGDAIVGHPDGWPPEVDGDKLVAEFVTGNVNSAIEATFNGSKETVERRVDDSPSVRRLREMTT